jgi:hypothetical protein
MQPCWVTRLIETLYSYHLYLKQMLASSLLGIKRKRAARMLCLTSGGKAAGADLGDEGTYRGWVGLITRADVRFET